MLKHIEQSGIYNWIHDTEFSDLSRWSGPAAIMDVYWRRGYGYRDICKNLQIYYENYNASTRESTLRQDVEKYCENFYKTYNVDLTRYVPCLKRHVQKLQFIGK